MYAEFDKSLLKENKTATTKLTNDNTNEVAKINEMILKDDH